MISPKASQAPIRPEVTKLDRRCVIGSLGLASLGFIASSSSANAFISNSSTPKVNIQTRASGHSFGKTTQRIDLSEVSVDWAHIQGSLLQDYIRYIWGLKLKNISPESVIKAHAKSRGAVWNTLPPKAWWTRMGYTLRVADRIAQEMNVREVEIVSAYRSPAYNSRCEGAKPGSWHQANVAVDVKFPMRASLVTATARNLRDRGLFKGGIGGYGGFTHIDTRGENVNW
jgi:Peptidase M15